MREQRTEAVNARWKKYREAVQNTKNTTVYGSINPNTGYTSYCDSDCDTYCDCNSSGSGSENERPQAAVSPPPLSLLQTIKDESKKYGFFLDDAFAKRIEQSAVPHNMFTGEHSFFEYAAEYVKQEYREKSENDKKKLFVKAFEWTDFQENYPAWRKKRLEAVNKRTAQERRENPPGTCEKCGGELSTWGGTLVCGSKTCGAMYDFDTEKEDWVFTDYIMRGTLGSNYGNAGA
jgi:hypothetical protein